MVTNMDKEAASIRQEAVKMSWYMRGGMTYDQILHLSYDERMIINNLIKENLETTKKTNLPFF
jgi:hypothetical protein